MLSMILNHAAPGINLALLIVFYYALRERLANMETRLTRMMVEYTRQALKDYAELEADIAARGTPSP